MPSHASGCTIRWRSSLGAAEGGLIEYSYLDAVKLAGHSCPTVASAFWLTRQALLALYGDTLPERGGLRVEFSAAAEDGVSGVMANVVSLITGAAGEGRIQGNCRIFRASFAALVQRRHSVRHPVTRGLDGPGAGRRGRSPRAGAGGAGNRPPDAALPLWPCRRE
jgi:hypothetical protein